MLESIEPKSAEPRTPPYIEDVADAVDYVTERWEQGIRPVVTVPKEFSASLKMGLRARSTWIPGLKVIAGTFDREPYLPGDENRIVVKANIKPEQIKPRMTGPQQAFQGVVVLEGPISPEQLEYIY